MTDKNYGELDSKLMDISKLINEVRWSISNMDDQSKKISDLEDQLYHTSRKVDEANYLLGHKIEVLEKRNKIMRDALVYIKDGNSNSAKLDAFYALKEIEGLNE